MKKQVFIGIIMIVLGVVFSAYRFYNRKIVLKTEYDNKIGYEWYMFDESSTIKEKSLHLDKYIHRLENEKMASNSAYFQARNSTSFKYNIQILKTLGNRLNEIQNMDPNSFEYQTAISQITEQESTISSPDVMYDLWLKQNHYSYYHEWLFYVFGFFQFGLMFGGILVVFYEWE